MLPALPPSKLQQGFTIAQAGSKYSTHKMLEMLYRAEVIKPGAWGLQKKKNKKKDKPPRQHNEICDLWYQVRYKVAKVSFEIDKISILPVNNLSF